MKKYLLLLLSVAAFTAKAQKDKEPFMIKSLTGDAIKSVEARTSGGSISVAGVASEARIEVYIHPGNGNDNATKEEIQRRLDQYYDLNVSAAGGKLAAIAKNKSNDMDWKKQLSISFKIYVPKDVTTDLKTSGGSISLKDVTGKQDFATSGGSLNVENVSGKIDGRTSGGSIRVKNASDEIELTTSGGSINAESCKGKMRLTTSGGSLKLEDLDGDIKATTSGGSVDGENIKGELITHTSGGSIHLDDLACSVEASTSGGNMDVKIKQLGKYVKLSNSAGSIQLELPKGKGVDLKLSGQRVKTGKLENFNGNIEDERVEGKLNGGGVPVTVRAGSGRVVLELN